MYHLLFAVLFYFYVNQAGGDAKNYWFTVKENLDIGIIDYIELGFGTYFMYALNYLPSGVMDLTFFTGSIFYALIGYFGFVYLYIVFKERIKYNTYIFKIPLFPTILFLPNLHFWSSNVGKDTLLFFCIALLFYAIKSPKQHIWKILLSLGLAYLVRPHIAAYLIAAFGVALLLDANLKLYKKLFIMAIIVAGFALIFDSLVAYLRIDSFDIDTIMSYSEDKVTKLSRDHTGSSVDISSYSYPLKVFTFLYRPLFIDGLSAFGLLASLENLILIILSVKLLLTNPWRYLKKSNSFVKALIIFFLLGALTFSLILGNLGIMLRQKNMFIPALLFICLWTFSYHTEVKTSNQVTPTN
ncbi:hypothetical protein G5B37_01400 [Rasiella rasia]|uniref:Uncharacterized protein n=1 Tax=Rasiella rasia TaxID=2744027 RepID=A0A6G6GI95_9FLAO|nr:hypothetical protein [Rasiella rasia]QIE58269.1 hypothetical protein G5B37_01400 [Rasiella rasia]